MMWGLCCLGAIVLALWQTGLFQQDILNLDGWPLLWSFLSTSLHPELSGDLLQLTLKATLTALAYAVCGTFFSIILGSIGEYTFTVRGEDVRLRGKIRNVENIHQNIFAAIEVAIALRYIKPIVESSPICEGRWQHG
jgi:hypothetical protein